MNRYWTGCILTLYSLFVLPSLCVGGMLEHPCGCETGMPPEFEDHHHGAPNSEHEHEHEHCAHIDHCGLDLCTQLVRGDEGEDPLPVPAVDFAVAAVDTIASLQLPRAVPTPALPPPRGPDLPVFPADLPLLL